MDQRIHLQEVIDSEIGKIKLRRRVVGRAFSTLQVKRRRRRRSTSTSENLTGLALSGGGVRSASFNLGMVQALDERGYFRQCDYLSTVSGGGFVGGYISSLAIDHEPTDQASSGEPQQAPSPKPSGKAQNKRRRDKSITPLASKTATRQPEFVRRLIYSGDYLRSHVSGLNRYLIGLFVINLFAFSGVLSAAAGMAWLYRNMDTSGAIFFLRELGFDNDVTRAFFPSFVLSVLWLLGWGLTLLSRNIESQPRSVRLILILFLTSVLFAVAALLGTGDVDLRGIAYLFGAASGDQADSWSSTVIRVLIITPILISILPYLKPASLLRSGTNPDSKPFERLIFKFCGYALVCGVPIVLFGFLAKENISGYNESRRALFPKDILGWERSSTTAPFFLDLEYADIELKRLRKNRESQSPDNDGIVPTLHGLRALIAENLVNANSKYTTDYVNAKLSSQKIPVAAHPGENPLSLWERRVLDDLIKTPLPAGQISAVNFADLKRLQRHLEDTAFVLNSREDLLSNPKLPYRWFSALEHFVSTIWRAPSQATKDSFGDAVANWNRLHATRSLMVRNISSAMASEPLLKSASIPPTRESQSNEEWTTLVRVRLLAERMEATISDASNRMAVEPSLTAGPPLNRETKNYLWQSNRELLFLLFPDTLEPPDVIYALTVLPHDQLTRVKIFFWSLLIFFVSGTCVNLNATGLHGYYRAEIAKTWINNCRGFAKNIPLPRLDTTSKGYPYHLISGTVHFPHFGDGDHVAVRDHFLFSQEYCGSVRTGFQPSSTYSGGNYDLASAIAISASAVTPALMPNILAAVLCFLFNLRTGQWLPNPNARLGSLGVVEQLIGRWASPFSVAMGLFRRQEKRPFCLVTDGGHFENLGIWPLLQRRCRLIICCDATHDPEYQFTDFVALMRQCRVEHGVDFQKIDEGRVFLRELTQFVTPNNDGCDPSRQSEHCYSVLRVQYQREKVSRCRRPEEAFLIYIKPTFPTSVDEDFDLEQYRRRNKSFPQDSTADQFFDAEKFESYRRLGYLLGQHLVADCLKGVPLECWMPDPPSISDHDEEFLASVEKAGSAQEIADLLIDDDIFSDRRWTTGVRDVCWKSFTESFQKLDWDERLKLFPAMAKMGKRGIRCLRDIADGKEPYSVASQGMRARARSYLDQE